MPGPPLTLVLQHGWYTEINTAGVDHARPGLYEWCIEGLGTYVGQYTDASRPRREYGLNVARLLAGHPCRRNKPDGFGRIHRELAKAVSEGRIVTLTLIENQDAKADRNRRERELVAKRRSEAERGGLEVLNSN